MQQYLEVLQTTLDHGHKKGDRTGTGTTAFFGMQKRFWLHKAFKPVLPTVTTKFIHLDSVIHELIWMLSGDTRLEYLIANGVRIWNEWVLKGTEVYRDFTFDELHAHLDKHWAVSATFANTDVPYSMTWPDEGEKYLQLGLKAYREATVITDAELIESGKADQLNYEHMRRIYRVVEGKEPRKLIGGDLGPVYGKTWRDIDDTRIIPKLEWYKFEQRGFQFVVDLPGTDMESDRCVITRKVDQLKEVLHLLEHEPDSRRIIICAWDPRLIEDQALPPCFTGDALVETSNGYKRIDNIDIGDMVRTGTGKLEPVNKVWVTPYTGKLLTIRPALNSIPIKCTPNHPFLVKGKGWVDAKDIKIGDFVATLKTQSTSGYRDYSYSVNVGNGVIHEKSHSCTLDDYYTFGYFVGNGWASHTGNRVSFAIPHHKLETVLPKLRKTIAISRKPGNALNVSTFETRSEKWNPLFREFGHKAHNKVIPDWILSAPLDAKAEFVKGFLEADGSTDKNGGINVCVTSPHLVLSLQRLFAETNITPRVSFQKKPETTVIEGRTVNQRDVYHLNVRFGNKVTNVEYDDLYVWLPIRKIKEEDYIGEVYNLDVGEEHTYTVNNIVNHNCHAFIQFFTRELSIQERLDFLVVRTEHEESITPTRGKQPLKDIEEYKTFHSAFFPRELMTDEWVNNHLDQADVPRRAISCQLYQRSADEFLGVPFNISFYSTMTHLLAKQFNMVAEEFIWTGGDCHIYSNHMDQVNLQLTREPYATPYLDILPEILDIREVKREDIVVHYEQYHPHIAGKVAV